MLSEEKNNSELEWAVEKWKWTRHWHQDAHTPKEKEKEDLIAARTHRKEEEEEEENRFLYNRWRLFDDKDELGKTVGERREVSVVVVDVEMLLLMVNVDVDDALGQRKPRTKSGNQPWTAGANRFVWRRTNQRFSWS